MLEDLNSEGSAVSAERIRLHKLMRFNPIKGLTPAKLIQQMLAFDSGLLRDFALTMEAIEERDDNAHACAPKRKGAISRRQWQILIPSDLPEGKKAEAEAHKAALQYFYGNITATDALDGNIKGDLSLVIRQMMDAVGKKYAVHEIIWQPSPDGLTARLNFVPLWFFENRTGTLRFLQRDYALDGVPLDEDNWMVTCGQGLMKACSIAYMFKQMPLHAWSAYCEKYGTPGIHAKSRAQQGSEQWEALKAAVSDFGENFSLITSADDAIEKLDMAANGEIPHPALVERFSRAITALWMGGDLSTMSKANAVGSNVQDEEGETLEMADAQMISSALNTNLTRTAIENIFGEDVKPLAYVQIIVPKKRDWQRDLAIDQALVGYGVPLSVSDALERYGRSAPKPGEPVLAAPIPPPSPFSSAASAPPRENSAPNEALADVAVAQALGVRTQWLAPVRTLINTLLARLQDPSTSDAAALEFLTEAKRRLPELFGSMDVSGLADVLEAAMGSATVAGLRTAIRKEKL